jgi:hypothetical protein
MRQSRIDLCWQLFSSFILVEHDKRGVYCIQRATKYWILKYLQFVGATKHSICIVFRLDAKKVLILLHVEAGRYLERLMFDSARDES